MRLICVIICLLSAALPAWAQDRPPEEPVGWVDDSELITEENIPESQISETERIFRDHQYDAAEFPEELQRFVHGSPAAETEADSAEQLREILSAPAFMQDIQPEVQNPDLLQRILQWVDTTISNIAQAIGVGAAGGGVLVYILVVVAMALLAYIIRQLIVNAGSSRARRRSKDELDELDPDVDLIRLAEQHAAAGDYRLAVRYRFLGVLRSMDLPASTLTTNSTLVRLVRSGHPALHREFMELVALFEDAWYGSLGCDSSQYSSASGLAGSLDRQIRLRGEAGS